MNNISGGCFGWFLPLPLAFVGSSSVYHSIFRLTGLLAVRPSVLHYAHKLVVVKCFSGKNSAGVLRDRCKGILIKGLHLE